MPDPGLSNPTSSSNSNTGVIIGAVVAAVVVLITVILIVACLLYRRKPQNENTQDTGNIQNAAYEGDTQTDRSLPEIPQAHRDYEEPAQYAQLDSSMRVPIDANYQSLQTRDHVQLGRDHNENVQRYASMNIDNNLRNEFPDESVYEEVP
ncbi:Hypothetical predicted protein [Paramuricea clavata]|uniref:Uncharacterized protein n=1 Tax=Paramuricea clavata TaxID=317549 RepID=A0A6S7KG74_PARCT|nr:Hypothetical predicted protein [Paramuricea clavata]